MPILSMLIYKNRNNKNTKLIEKLVSVPGVVQNSHLIDMVRLFNLVHCDYTNALISAINIMEPDEITKRSQGIYLDNAISWAVYRKSYVMTHLLLPYFDPNIVTFRYGHTLLHWSILRDCVDIFSLLVYRGGDMYALNFEQKTPTDYIELKPNFKHVIDQYRVWLRRTLYTNGRDKLINDLWDIVLLYII